MLMNSCYLWYHIKYVSTKAGINFNPRVVWNFWEPLFCIVPFEIWTCNMSGFTKSFYFKKVVSSWKMYIDSTKALTTNDNSNIDTTKHLLIQAQAKRGHVKKTIFIKLLTKKKVEENLRFQCFCLFFLQCPIKYMCFFYTRTVERSIYNLTIAYDRIKRSKNTQNTYFDCRKSINVAENVWNRFNYIYSYNYYNLH